MVAKVASRIFITIFASLAICLSAAVLGCAGNILHTYNAQKNGNPWWLPLWPQHFDDRGLKALIGGGTSVVVLNAVCIASLFKQVRHYSCRYYRHSKAITDSPKHKWQKDAIFVSAFLSAIAAGVAVIYPAVLNQQSPTRDTMQSWTCTWSSTTDAVSAGIPANFPSLCLQNVSPTASLTTLSSNKQYRSLRSTLLYRSSSSS